MTAILTRQQRLSIGQAPITAPVAIPSPGGGWNTRDSFDGMDPLDAVTLDNWFPDAGGGMPLRRGFSVFAEGLGAGHVETLAEFNSGAHPATTVNRLVAACDNSLFEIHTGTPAVLGTGFTNDRWQSVNFLGKMFLVNGADTPQIYDGTVIANTAFTGVTQSTLVGVWSYQQRLFFWQNNSTGFYYALLNSISGAVAFYDLASFCPRGGNLIAMTTISYDGGNGVQDYAVFIMSSGDMLVFQGNDPALINAWVMIGQYRMSPPVSPRAVTSYGGDSFITTFDDHVSLSAMFTALKLGAMPPRSKVSGAVRNAVNANQIGFGWQAIFYPRGRSLIFNIPNTDGSFNQHVCNTGLQNQPWCRYVGMNGSCFGLFNDHLYFGAAGGTVYQADTGANDNGNPITGIGQQAWNKIGNANRKRLATVRPVVQAAGGIAYTFEIGFDYQPLNIILPPQTFASGSPWDTSPWDISPWSPEVQIDPSWRVAGGSGTAAGWALVVSTKQPVSWLRTDLRFEGGNAL